jgi:ParB family chromosome partitioning protein
MSQSAITVVYVHRRVPAARELGTSVKALVRQLADTDLVVTQRVENASRHEKAVFARQMKGAGHSVSRDSRPHLN